MIRRGIEPLNGQYLVPTLYAWIEQAHELTLDIAANLFATYQWNLFKNIMYAPKTKANTMIKRSIITSTTCFSTSRNSDDFSSSNRLSQEP